MRFFVDNVIACLLAFDIFTLFQVWNDRVGVLVLIGRLVRWSRDDQRRSRFIDQDRVDLVDDGEVVTTLYAGSEVEFHVVAQVVEAKFVVRAVSNIGSVSSLALKVVHVVLDTTDFKSEKTMNLAHPLRVARSEIVVDSHNVNAA